VFVTIVIVGNSAVSGQAHSGHVPSDVDVEIFGGGIANISWVGLFTIQSGAPVTSGQKVTGMIEFVQNWSGTSSQNWEVAPATISPDFGQSDWNVTFAWWAVVPHFTGIIMSSDSAVGQVVNNGFVDVLGNSVLLGFGGKSFDETSFGQGSVGSENVLLVEVQKFSF
jgi:hypothetical protein